MRTVGANGARTAEAIRKSATRLIYEHGFEAVSLRQLAADVGLQPGSLYNHFKTKQDLLSDIINDHMDDLLKRIHGELTERIEPLDRLSAFTVFHIRYHLEIRQQLYVATTELRSLSPENRAVVVAKRKQYSDILSDTIVAGVKSGVFAKQDAKVTTFAILAMLTGISTWYSSGGRLGADNLIKQHLALVLRAVLDPASSALPTLEAPITIAVAPRRLKRQATS